MASKRYTFREGSRVGGIKPETVAAELARLRKTGPLTTTAVLEAASDPDSPLHGAFIWDDTRAADLYRKEQARRLIRALIEVKDDKPRSVYVHVSQTAEDEGEYQPLDVVIRQPDALVLALIEAQRRLASARAAVDELKAAAANQPDDYIARIALAAQALSTAEQAVKALH